VAQDIDAIIDRKLDDPRPPYKLYDEMTKELDELSKVGRGSGSPWSGWVQWWSSVQFTLLDPTRPRPFSVQGRSPFNAQLDVGWVHHPWDGFFFCFLLFWHAPLGARSAIRRHQAPQRTVLGQVDCFVQCEVVGSQIMLDGVQPRDTRTL